MTSEAKASSAAKLCIDLCSGEEGFCAAFKDAGWEVVTIDIDERFHPTLAADLLTTDSSDIEAATKLHRFDLYGHIVILFSPMCNHFSTAGLVNGWPRKGIRKAFELIGAGLEIVADIRERAGEKHVWVMENPVSVIKFFMPRPNSKIHLSDYGSENKKPTYLWGNIKLPLVLVVGDWLKVPRENYFNRQKERRGIMGMKRSSERARIPRVSAKRGAKKWHWKKITSK